MKKAYSILFLFLMLTQQVLPVNIVQESQQGWFSSLVNSGYDLVKQGVVLSMLAALVYKAKEYGWQKEMAENAIKNLNKKLEKTGLLDEKRADIQKKIKEQELIRDRKKTLGQKAAQGVIGLMGMAYFGLIMYTLWDPYPEMRERDPNAMNYSEFKQYLELTGKKGMSSEQALAKIKEQRPKQISIEDFLKR